MLTVIMLSEIINNILRSALYDALSDAFMSDLKTRLTGIWVTKAIS